jgi:hypothetical protein
VKQFAVPGNPSALHADRSVLWVGAMNAEVHLAVARVNITTGNVEPSVALPSSYKAGGPTASIHSDIIAVPMGADLLVGFGATDYLVRIHSNGSMDTLAIPVRTRRGVPMDVDERVKRAGRSEDYYTMMSSLFALEPVRSDVVMAAHLDISMRPGVTFPQMAGGPPAFLYTFYVSLIDLRAHRACVDLRVPVSREQYPTVGVRGDTLFAIDQDSLSADQPWMIRRFVIHEDRCVWQ